MAMNTTPKFPATPICKSVVITTANTAMDGTGTMLDSGFLAGADGAKLAFVKVRHKGTNVATVLRIWVYDGSAYWLWMERTIPTNSLSQTTESADIPVPLNLQVPSGYKIYYTIGTTVAAGLYLTLVGGQYS